VESSGIIKPGRNETSEKRQLKGPEGKPGGGFTPFWKGTVVVTAIFFSLFHLYTAYMGSLMAYKQRSVHLGFAMVLVFLLYPFGKKKPRQRPSVIDLFLAVLSISVVTYGIINIDILTLRGGSATPRDLFVGGIAILLVLEAGRRSVGLALPILACCFLLYGYFGRSIPGPLNHRGFPVQDIIYQMYLTTDGIFSMAIGVSATFVVLFIIFGSFLARTGIIPFFNQMALGIAGGQPGGQAKVAVVASSAMGMISGSAVANAMTVGSFTIPLMKKSGYSSSFAGAVEAVASTGGQIMPPVMGAAAFVMAEFLETSYLKVMIAAILPALLYYGACFAQIHLRALKIGLKGLPRETLPSPVRIMKRSGQSLIPLIALVLFLVSGFTATLSAALCIPLAIIVGFFRAETRINFKKTLEALEEAGKMTVSVAMATAVVGFVIGITGLTNLGVNLADQIVQLAGDSRILMLCFTAVACLILGMGLPTTGSYIIASIVAAPILVKMGIPDLPSNFFIFYFAVISMITPPVALAAYATAGIAQANPNKVGWAATRLGISGFVVPFMFVYSPSLFILGSSVGDIAWNVARASIALIALSICFEGFLRRPLFLWERIVFLCGALLLIEHGVTSDIVGFGTLGAGSLVHLWMTKRGREQALKKS
jgi:TRAP transporter 4TM/12TM fusion protein